MTDDLSAAPDGDGELAAQQPLGLALSRVESVQLSFAQSPALPYRLPDGLLEVGVGEPGIVES